MSKNQKSKKVSYLDIADYLVKDKREHLSARDQASGISRTF